MVHYKTCNHERATKKISFLYDGSSTYVNCGILQQR